MGFFTALAGALASCSFYLVLYFTPESVNEEATAMGTALAFIGLHVALKRVVRNHSLHVIFLFIAASLMTLDSTFDNKAPVFLITLLGGNILLLLFVALTYEVSSADSSLQQIEGPDSEPGNENGK